MQLYEKITYGKKTTYKLHEPYSKHVVALEQEQVIALLTTFTLAMLMSVSNQIVSHSRSAREIKKVEDAIIALARLNKNGVDETVIDLGVLAWNAAIKEIAKSGGNESGKEVINNTKIKS